MPQDRIVTVLTPIDTESYRPIERREACRASGLDPGRRYVLFMGRFDDQVKQVSVLINSFAAVAPDHPDTDLVVAGDGPDGDRLRRLADRVAPGRVRFPGWVQSIDATVQLYNAAACLVLPSLREGFPTVVGEAMACGTPVLASDVGSVSVLVRNGETGWLVTPGDADALTGRLSWMLGHQDEEPAMRSRARAAAVACVSPAGVSQVLRGCLPVPHRRDG